MHRTGTEPEHLHWHRTRKGLAPQRGSLCLGMHRTGTEPEHLHWHHTRKGLAPQRGSLCLGMRRTGTEPEHLHWHCTRKGLAPHLHLYSLHSDHLLAPALHCEIGIVAI